MTSPTAKPTSRNCELCGRRTRRASGMHASCERLMAWLDVVIVIAFMDALRRYIQENPPAAIKVLLDD